MHLTFRVTINGGVADARATEVYGKTSLPGSEFTTHRHRCDPERVQEVSDTLMPMTPIEAKAVSVLLASMRGVTG